MARGSVPTTPPIVVTLDWGSLVRKQWGDEWHQPQIVYRFSNGRKFIEMDGQGGPYSPEDKGSAGQ
jgi:hypothetical protein